MLRHPRYTLVITVVLLLFGWSLPVCSSAPSPSEAQKHFAKAVEFQKAGKLDQAIAEFKIVKKLAPGQIAPVADLGILYAQKGDVASAESAFKQALVIDPKNELVLTQLTKLLVARKKDTQALPYARKLLDLKPKDFDTRFIFGVVNLRLRNYESALDAFKTTLHMKPNDEASLYNLSYCYIGLKRFSDAMETLDRLVKIAPDATQAVLMAGYAAEKIGDNSAAIKYFESASGKAPDFAIPALANLSRIYNASGNREKSVGALKRLVKLDKNNFAANLSLGKLAYGKKDMKEAEARFLVAKAANPNDVEVNTDLAVVQVQLNKLDAAQASAAAAVKAEPKSVKSLEVYGYVQETRKRFDDAIATYRKWAAYYPNDPAPSVRIANLLAFQGKSDLAYKEFESGLKKDPKNLETLNAYARALGNNREYGKAYEIYSRSMKIKPGVASTMLTAAYCLEKESKHDEAVALLKKTSEIDPKSEGPYLAMGRVYQSQQKDDLAAEVYTKALGLAPKNETASRALIGLYDKKGKYEDEIAIYRKLKENGSPAAQYDAVAIPRILDEKLGKLDSAVEECRKLVESDSKSIIYRSSLAGLLVKKKDYSGAIEQYAEIAKDKDPGANAYAYEEIGGIQEKAGKPDEAITAYKKALGIRPDANRALTSLSSIYEAQKKTDEFCAYLKTLVEPAKNDLPYRVFWDTFKKAGKTDEGIKVLEEAEKKSPDNPQITMVLADAYQAAERKDQAVTEYKKLIAKNSADPRANRALGYLYKSMGRDAEAVECLAKAAKVFSVERTLLLDVAGLHEKLGKKPEALAAYKDYLKIDPANKEIKQKVFTMENPGLSGAEPAKTPPPAPTQPEQKSK